MLSSRKLAPFLVLSSLLSFGLLAGAAHASDGDFCLIQSGQSRTQIDETSIDDPTCTTLATALSQNGLQFSTAELGTLEPTPFSSLACGLTFVGTGDVVRVRISIYDPGNSGESQALCQTFQQAGFALDPPVHWAQICFYSPAIDTQAGAIAAMITCSPSGLP